MKIAYFTESLYPLVDGVSRTLARLFDTLTDRSVDFRVFSPFVPTDESVRWRDRVRPVRYFRFPPYPDYRVSLPGGRAVADDLADFAPDLIHVVSPTPMAVWAQRYARRHAIPVVSSFHTHFVSYFRYYGVRSLERGGWRMMRWFYGRCDRVYAPSWSIVRELEGEGIGNVELWSRGIDARAFSPGHRDAGLRSAVGASDDVPILLLVSRLVKEKDLADLVHVHQILRERGTSFRLALVGDGPMRAELETRLPHAHFAGYQAGEALARWYASSDVFVFPSTTETLGNVVLEALASGLPAVVVDRGGPQDLIEPGETGFVARANDPEDIAHRVDLLLRDAVLRSGMGRSARAVAAERDWGAINGRLMASYERVIARQPPVSEPRPKRHDAQRDS
ncbi:MAG: glycosyltransferase family 1 protein [Gemmatimonadetes bacterium]|nr:glycosyltransferase family 1 protein [Gemmatimonadota bacterium]